MVVTDTTSIRIKKDTWRRLRHRKGPGESFDDVLTEILDEFAENVDEWEAPPKWPADQDDD